LYRPFRLLFAPERLFADVGTAAGVKQTRPLFAAVKAAQGAVTVRRTPELESFIYAGINAHPGNASF
jgi:hypothetical protein